MKTQFNTFIKAKIHYETALNNIEKILYQCEKYRREEDGITKILGMNAKMTAALKEHADALDNYKIGPEKIKTECDNCLNIVMSIMEAMKQQEVRRTEFLKSGLKKMINCELDMESSYRKISEQTNTFIDKISSENDIKKLLDIVPRNESKKEFTPVQIKKSGWNKLYEVYKQFHYDETNTLDYINLVEETKKQILEKDDEEYKSYRSEHDKLCIELLKPQYGSFLKLVNNIKTNNNEVKGRIAFLDALRKAINDRGNSNISDREARPIKEAFKDFITLVL